MATHAERKRRRGLKRLSDVLRGGWHREVREQVIQWLRDGTVSLS